MRTSTSPSPSSNRTCGFPASGSQAKALVVFRTEHSQGYQAKVLQVCIEAEVLRDVIGALTPAFQMMTEPMHQLEVELPILALRMPQREVVSPTSQMPIHAIDQIGQRLVTVAGVDIFPQPFALFVHCLARGEQPPPTAGTPKQVALIPEAVPQEVEGLARLPSIKATGLFPV